MGCVPAWRGEKRNTAALSQSKMERCSAAPSAIKRASDACCRRQRGWCCGTPAAQTAAHPALPTRACVHTLHDRWRSLLTAFWFFEWYIQPWRPTQCVLTTGGHHYCCYHCCFAQKEVSCCCSAAPGSRTLRLVMEGRTPNYCHSHNECTFLAPQ